MDDPRLLNVREMFKDRGYIFLNNQQINIHVKKNTTIYNIEIWKNNNDENVVFFCCVFSSIKNNLKEAIEEYLRTSGNKKAFIIYNSSTLDSFKNDLNLIFLRINLFEINIMNHYLQPKFYKIDPKYHNIVKNYFIGELPKITSNDPISIWLDLKKNDLVYICQNKKCNTFKEYKCSCNPDEFRVKIID
jgi:DNA-directed RNA polymerase subunit H (RpoH/RPB5)